MKRSSPNHITNFRPQKRSTNLRKESDDNNAFYFSVLWKSERVYNNIRYYKWVGTSNLANMFIKAQLLHAIASPWKKVDDAHCKTVTALVSLKKDRGDTTLLPRAYTANVLQESVMRGIDIYYAEDDSMRKLIKHTYEFCKVDVNQIGYSEEVINTDEIDNNTFMKCVSHIGTRNVILTNYGNHNEESTDSVIGAGDDTTDYSFSESSLESETSEESESEYESESESDDKGKEALEIRLERALNTIDHIVETLDQVFRIIKKYNRIS